jgi:hypothetical protein
MDDDLNYIERKFHGFFLYFDLIDCVEKVNYSLLTDDVIAFLYENKKKYENEWY